MNQEIHFVKGGKASKNLKIIRYLYPMGQSGIAEIYIILYPMQYNIVQQYYSMLDVVDSKVQNPSLSPQLANHFSGGKKIYTHLLSSG